MTPWGTGAVGKHVLKQIWTQGAAGQTPPPCALLQGAAPTPQAVTETMPCLCLHKCLPSCSTKEANFPIVCKTSKSREESWHSWCGSRGWMACSPSHSPHRILLPDTQHRGLVVWLPVTPDPAGRKMVASLPERHSGCCLSCSPCWQPRASETLVT